MADIYRFRPRRLPNPPKTFDAEHRREWSRQVKRTNRLPIHRRRVVDSRTFARYIRAVVEHRRMEREYARVSKLVKRLCALAKRTTDSRDRDLLHECLVGPTSPSHYALEYLIGRRDRAWRTQRRLLLRKGRA